MRLTKAQANARLSKIETAEDLRKLIREIDTKGTGTITLLWSGYAAPRQASIQDGLHSGEITASMKQANPNLRTIASTEAARFLELDKSSKDFNQALSDKLKSIFKDNPDEINSFLYGPSAGTPRKRTGKGIWDDVSHNFASQAQGDVRLVVGGAGLDRVFAQTEVQALLNNPGVKSIEGVPIEGLKDLAKNGDLNKVVQLLMGLSEANTGMIQVHVDGTGRPIQAKDGTYRLDASDYMKMNTLGSNPPAGMRSVMEFIPEERRLRHSQAVEEIFKLHPILRGRNYTLPLDPDPFRHQSAIARVGTFAGKIADVASMTTMLAEAGTMLQRGDHRGAHDTVTSWVIENAGAFVAGRVATMLVAPLMAAGPLGMIIGAGIIIGASIGGGELAKKLRERVERGTGEIEEYSSPLILDLDGNGIQTLAMVGTSLYFNHDSNGFAERTGWVGPNDGLLVLDLNNNGKIDHGGELFGNHTRLANHKFASNGFEALARYDNNRDGRIDRRDSIWTRLRVWRDRNSNAVSDAGEWLNLDSVNVKALLLKYTNSREVDRQGNAHKQKGSFLLTNNKLAALTDVWFARNTLDSQQLNLRPVDAATAALPNILGMGIVPSLHQALMAPGAEGLRQTLNQWLGASRLERMNLTKKLLFEWVDAENNPFANPDRIYCSEDPFISEKVAVVEKLSGQMLTDTEAFVGVQKIEVIEKLVADIEVWIDMILSSQVHAQPLINLATPMESDWFGPLMMDPSASVEHLRTQFNRDPDPAFLPMVQWQLAQHGAVGRALFDDLRELAIRQSDALGVAMAQQQSLPRPWQWLRGSAEEDELIGSSQDDFIEAGTSHDALRGLAGNDTLHGGPGIDNYAGGEGADTYFISQNQANAWDSIMDASSPVAGADRVIFWEVTSSQVQVQQSGEDVSFYAGQQHLLKVERQLTAQHRIEEFHFADGIRWDHNTLLLQLPIAGTPGNDRLVGSSQTSNRLQGLSGQDTLIGGPLADHLEGQQGNDLLTGLAGEDSLDGGEGHDTLEGGEGSDRYVFTATGGHDRIVEGQPLGSNGDRVLFSNLATTALTRVQAIGPDLQLHFGGSTSLTLVNQLHPLSRIEQFDFANGTTWDHATLLQQVS